MFKRRKNKTFNYKSRFSGDGKAIEDGEDEKEFISKWRQQTGNKVKMKSVLSIRTMILVLVLLLISMYLLNQKIN